MSAGASAQSDRVAGTIVSLSGSAVGTNGPALSAWLDEPEAVDVDSAGNVFAGNTKSCVVQKIDREGTISTVVGTGICGFNGDAKPGPETQLTLPRGVYVDDDGSLYIADSGAPVNNEPGNCRIRMLGADGVVRTVAGIGECDFGGDGGPATDAKLKNAKSMVVDSEGNLVIADYDNCRIRKVEDGIISTVLGSNCDIVDPFGIAIDGMDNLFVADQGNSRILLITPDTRVVTLAGAPDVQYAEDVAIDAAGNVFIADTGHCVIKELKGALSERRSLSIVAGTGVCGYTGDGDALTVQLNRPSGIAIDPDGGLLIADKMNCRIRRLEDGAITTVAGNGGCHTVSPAGLAIDPGGNVFVSDSNVLDCHVLRLDPAGNVSRVAGLQTAGAAGDELPCGFTGDGEAESVKLDGPRGLALDASGDLYIADTDNCRVRRVHEAIIETIAGSGSCHPGIGTGVATRATLVRPSDVAVAPDGTIYVADTENCAVRAVHGDTISTVAGTGHCGDAGDGGPATSAELSQPRGIGLDKAGDLYIADTMNCRIRRVDIDDGLIAAVMGNGECGPDGDGADAVDAALDQPQDVAVADDGRIFVADTGNCRIRSFAPEGVVSTVAGNGQCGYGGDGAEAAAAALNHPTKLAIDSEGNVYVTDTGNERVRVIVAPIGRGVTIQKSKTGATPSSGASAVTSGGSASEDSGGGGLSTATLLALSLGTAAAVALMTIVGYRLLRGGSR